VDDDCSVATIDQLPIPLLSIGNNNTHNQSNNFSFSNHCSDYEDDPHSMNHPTLVDSIPIPTKGARERRESGISITSTVSLDSSLGVDEDEDGDAASASNHHPPLRGRRASVNSYDPNNGPHSSSTHPKTQRRGSVTKYSLDSALSSLDDDMLFPNHSNKKHDVDDRSIVSEQLPPRPRRLSNIGKGVMQNSSSRKVAKNKPSLSGLLASFPSHGSPTSNNEEMQDDQSVGSCRSEGLLGGRQLFRRRSSAGAKIKPPLSGLLSSLSSHVSPTHHQSDDQVPDDQSVGSCMSEGVLGGQKRYKRRGSVTKFSLDEALASVDRNVDNDHDHNRRCRDHDDDRSTFSEQLPPRPKQSKSGSTARRSTARRSSVTKINSGSHHQQHCHDTLGASEEDAGGRTKYQRRGSVTKYNLGGD
jgi:hypothetical protein